MPGAQSIGACGRKYARLSHDDRRHVVDILRDTKPDLPDYFGKVLR